MKRSAGSWFVLSAVFFATLVIVIAIFERARIQDLIIEMRKPRVPEERSLVQPTPVPSPKPTPPGATPTPRPSHVPTPTPVTGAVNLPVPFRSQAPAGDWSLPWQEACEEASSVLVDAFWKGQLAISVQDMEQRILALVDWSNQNLGYYKHTTAAETARYLREALGYRDVRVEYNVGTDRIAEHVRAGRPVIVPLAGRDLGNPYYTPPGPVYHMLVVKGIAENGDIITNDVGTRHGRNLTYAPDVFQAAMHEVPAGGDDWPPGVDPVAYVNSGRPAIITVYPQ